MERIDRPQQYSSEASPVVGDGCVNHTLQASGSDASSHWLSSAMAMWIQQDENQTFANRDIRHTDINPR
jgi:hypothetical protein